MASLQAEELLRYEAWCSEVGQKGALGRENSMDKGLEARDYQCVLSYLWKLESESSCNLPSPKYVNPGLSSGRVFYLPDVCPIQALP